MTDTFTASKRSEIMSRIAAKNTSPELAVRKILFKLGCRYRIHDRKLCGTSDIVLSKQRKAIFVNGCFWHQHKRCRRSSKPKTNINYWNKKLEFNINKQKKDIINLRKLGWKVFIIWECQTKNQIKLTSKIRNIYEKVNNI